MLCTLMQPAKCAISKRAQDYNRDLDIGIDTTQRDKRAQDYKEGKDQQWKIF